GKAGHQARQGRGGGQGIYRAPPPNLMGPPAPNWGKHIRGGTFRRHVVHAKNRGSVGGRCQVDGDRSEERPLASIAEPAEKSLARSTDHDWQRIVLELCEAGNRIAVLM